MDHEPKCSAELGAAEEQAKGNRNTNSSFQLTFNVLKCICSTEVKVIQQQQNSHKRSGPCQLKY